MKNRDRFIENIDSTQDKNVINNINQFKRMIRQFDKYIIFSAYKLEYGSVQMCWNCLVKASLGIQSSLELIQLGYIGSAKALFRQIYEFLVWAKVALDFSENSKFETIKDIFYNNRRTETDVDATRYSKPTTIMINDLLSRKGKYRLKFTIDDTRFSNIQETNSELLNLCQYFYDDMCALTHASNEAQQSIVPDNHFYEEMNETLCALGDLCSVLIEVFDQYYSKYMGSYVDDRGTNSVTNMLIDAEIATKKIQFDKFLDKLNPHKKGGTPFLVVCFSGLWEMNIKEEPINDKT